MRNLSLLCVLTFMIVQAKAQQFKIENNLPIFKLGEKNIIAPPPEGLWSVATDWRDDWATKWMHGNPQQMEKSGNWTILKGIITLPQGDLIVRDAYTPVNDNLIRCVRRWEWRGRDTLRKATLSVRFAMQGNELRPFAPGISYYGNPAGAKINSKIIPVYNGKDGEFQIFEDHRYSMPFVMLENGTEKYAAAVHTTPSPVRGAVLSDQWWSMGTEAHKGHSEFILYSGPIGYNGERSIAKALQHTPMRYTDTYLNLEPGRVIEKEFFIELYPIEKEGSGFQKPVYTSIQLFKPFNVEQFSTFDEIVRSKANFATSRWIEQDSVCGWGMYNLNARKAIVMGWCGQAASLGFAMQHLGKYVDEPGMKDKIQRSLDFLATYPVDNNGYFPVEYHVDSKQFNGGDNVSCGQAMYNFAKAIESGRKNYHTRKWEAFLRKACDGQAARILNNDWRPVSTAEGFIVAPLAIAAKLFKNNTYKEAAIKAADTFAARHLSMREPYWGGTLDATCEDKEGAWAAFQAFLAIYEQWGDKKYLTYAKHAMDVCLSYVVVWDIPLPAGRMADHNFKTTGWTVVSPQNQHIDIYGVLFAPEVYRMGQIMKNEDLKKLAKVMYRSCFQLTDPYGSQGEQLQQTNFAQHGDMNNVYKLRGGYSENWTVFWITAHFLNAAARFEQMNTMP